MIKNIRWKQLPFICLLLSATALNAQVANDRCAGAFTLTAATDTTCTPIGGTFANAGQELPPDSCNGEISSTAFDIWYKFVATATSHVVDVTTPPPAGGGFQGTGAVVRLYDNCNGNVLACGNPQIIRFGQFVIVQSGLTRVSASGLTVGNTYYVRIYTYGDNPPAPGDDTFTICVHAPADPPANDSCANAVALTVADTCNPVMGTLEGASQETAGEACGDDPASATAFDVWYSFLAAQASEIIMVEPLGQGQGAVAPVIELYAICGGTMLDCENPLIFPGFGAISGTTTMITSGLTPGTTYLVRVFHYGDEGAIEPEFNICVYNAPPPPSNDLCGDAVSLTVQDTCNPTEGTLNSATQESAPTACGADDPSATAFDVWYSFQAAETSQLIEVSPLQNGQGGVAPVIELYDACGGTQLACANPTIFPGFGAIPGTTILTATGLTPGTTYVVRVFHYGDGPAADGDFVICVYNMPPPPANDTCSGAFPLTVGTDCTPTQGTVDFATEDMPPADCEGSVSNEANDVWYSFVANNTEEIIEVASQTINAVVMVYDACGGSVIACANPDGSGITALQANGLTAGNTYYIRVYNDGPAGPNGDFFICVYDVPPTEPNDDCANAITITQASSRAACNPTAASTLLATQSAEPTTCGVMAIDDDIWYKFTATSAEVVAAAGGKSTSLATTPIGFTLYHLSCDGQQSAECTPGVAGDSLVFRNLIAGDVYYLRTYTRGNQNRGTFQVCVYGYTAPARPANDTCASAIQVMPANTDTCITPLPGNLTGAQQENPVDSCEGQKASPSANDVWYKFTAIADAHDIQVRSQSVAAVVALYEADGLSCGDFISCKNPRLVTVGGNTFGAPGTTTLKALGLTVGTTYFVRVFHYGNNTPGNSNFTICVFRDSAATTGLEQHEAITRSLQVFPNPAANQVSLSFSALDDVEIRLLNLNGKVILSRHLGNIRGIHALDLNLEGISSGVYTLQVLSNRETVTRKLVKE